MLSHWADHSRCKFVMIEDSHLHSELMQTFPQVYCCSRCPCIISPIKFHQILAQFIHSSLSYTYHFFHTYHNSQTSLNQTMGRPKILSFQTKGDEALLLYIYILMTQSSIFKSFEN